MKRILSLSVALALLIFALPFTTIAQAGNENQPYDLPEYEYEDYEDASNSQIVIAKTRPSNIPAEGVRYPHGGTVNITAGVVNNPTMSVSFSLSFGFFSLSVTPDVLDAFAQQVVSYSVNIPAGGYYSVNVISKVRVTPIITRRKLIGSHVWSDYAVTKAKTEVLRLDFETIRLR